MTYNIISTGSTGNAVVLHDDIMVDCGVLFSKLKPVIEKLKIVLLTHGHSDHFNPATINRLARERPTLRWACCEWMVTKLAPLVDKRFIDVLDCDHFYNYGSYLISPVRLTHSVPNCGWRIYANIDNGDAVKTFYATDTGNLDGIEAKYYDYYFVEANYEESELRERMNAKLDAGQFAYEALAELNHLSQQQASEWISMNARSDSRIIILHQHKLADRL